MNSVVNIISVYTVEKHGKIMHTVTYNSNMKSRILDLLYSQGMGIEHLHNLPKLGVLTTLGEYTVAAAFLRIIEGNKSTAILDSLITNAELLPTIRNDALNQTVSELLKLAKEQGITKIIAFSTDKNTLMRAKRFGFEELPHQVITLDITS